MNLNLKKTFKANFFVVWAKLRLDFKLLLRFCLIFPLCNLNDVVGCLGNMKANGVNWEIRLRIMRYLFQRWCLLILRNLLVILSVSNSLLSESHLFYFFFFFFVANDVLSVIAACFNENPEKRPSFQHLDVIVKFHVDPNENWKKKIEHLFIFLLPNLKIFCEKWKIFTPLPQFYLWNKYLSRIEILIFNLLLWIKMHFLFVNKDHHK